MPTRLVIQLIFQCSGEFALLKNLSHHAYRQNEVMRTGNSGFYSPYPTFLLSQVFRHMAVLPATHSVSPTPSKCQNSMESLGGNERCLTQHLVIELPSVISILKSWELRLRPFSPTPTHLNILFINVSLTQEKNCYSPMKGPG